ncbi:MAG: DUF1015 domain-containing protein [Planctomycetaceae bacterium]|nr:DUF1015 domain-containing protein [Planctomycetaceae bacterium]
METFAFVADKCNITGAARLANVFSVVQSGIWVIHLMVSISAVPRALVPVDSHAADQISAPNYDEFQSDQEVYDLLQSRPECVLRVTMAHCAVDDFQDCLKDGSPEALGKASSHMEELIASSHTRIAQNVLWVYEVVSPKRPNVRQLGLGGLARTQEIRTEQNPTGVIIRNEGIRPEKAEGRAKLIQSTNAYIGTVNCAVQDSRRRLTTALESYTEEFDPSFKTIDEAGNTHRVWLVDDGETSEDFRSLLADEPFAYVADGNHRSAAAAALGHDHFLAVFFTTQRMRLEPYNRLVEDVGLPIDEIIQQLNSSFEVETIGDQKTFRPANVHEIGFYANGQWLSLTPRPETFDPNNAAESIDADIIQRHLFDAILGIADPRDKRLNFVGGNKDSAYLKARVDSGEYAFALSLAPVTIQQFVGVCEQDRFMPPKSTWFDPKIRSGLVTVLLD